MYRRTGHGPYTTARPAAVETVMRMAVRRQRVYIEPAMKTTPEGDVRNMYYENEKGTFNFIAGILLGAVMGASIALLAAPESGKRTRRRIVRAVSSAGDHLEDWGDDIGDMISRRGRRMRRRLRS